MNSLELPGDEKPTQITVKASSENSSAHEIIHKNALNRVGNGSGAIDILTDFQPNLILKDVIIPEMYGFDIKGRS